MDANCKICQNASIDAHVSLKTFNEPINGCRKLFIKVRVTKVGCFIGYHFDKVEQYYRHSRCIFYV